MGTSMINNSKLNHRSFKKGSKFVNQSSIMEADDSQICEEAGVNGQNIKTSHFNLRKVEDLNVSRPHHAQGGSLIEDQINSLLHQIE
jgi:hypothetical protein